MKSILKLASYAALLLAVLQLGRLHSVQAFQYSHMSILAAFVALAVTAVIYAEFLALRDVLVRNLQITVPNCIKRLVISAGLFVCLTGISIVAPSQAHFTSRATLAFLLTAAGSFWAACDFVSQFIESRLSKPVSPRNRK